MTIYELEERKEFNRQIINQDVKKRAFELRKHILRQLRIEFANVTDGWKGQVYEWEISGL